MSDAPFDRRVVYPREKPSATDINLAQAQIDATERWVAERLYDHIQPQITFSAGSPAGVGAYTGFIGDAFRVHPTGPASMTIQMRKGLGYYVDAADAQSAIDGVVGLNDVPAMKPLVLKATKEIPVPVADPVNPRIDIVEVRVDRRRIDQSLRLVLDPATGVFTPEPLDKTLTFELEDLDYTTAGSDSTAPISYKTGTPGAVPAAPATSPGYVKVAEVRVDALAVSVPSANIVDTRPLLFPHGQARVIVRGRYTQATGTWEVTHVNAPPGIKVGSRAVGVQFQFFVFSGGGGYVHQATGFVSNTTGVSSSEQITVLSEDSDGAVDAVIQTALAAASATNGLVVNVGVGQQYDGVVLTPIHSDAATVQPLTDVVAATQWDLTMVMDLIKV